MNSFLKLLLGEFGNSIGVSVLPFDDAGNCALVVGTTPLSLNISVDSRVLTLSSRLDAVVDERRAEQALTETMHLFRLHGFCLVIEPGVGLMLRCRLFSENLTLSSLSETMSQFVGAVEWIRSGKTGSEKRSDADDYMNQLCVRA
ncbi:type III secretion system chaperone [Noviherbaspirillum sp.]|uniref:type III secretion system chaperone n=1 Tax=Noviherbaspirillum sp. TaxID=1926288 RepID=UPI002B49BB08|nr:type III secretion system chaperone [Noviherbaspirillum sp.]HJV80556.1 type III secretion system chaperone [Noviherbaspirillum sp.]